MTFTQVIPRQYTMQQARFDTHPPMMYRFPSQNLQRPAPVAGVMTKAQHPTTTLKETQLGAIDDLIAQIDDTALRARLKEEADRLRREQKFGLVFEEHLPELAPVYTAPIQPGCLAARRRRDRCRRACRCRTRRLPQPRHGGRICVPAGVVGVWRPIFPALTPLDRVQHGPDDAPWHTLIEADNYHALQLLNISTPGRWTASTSTRPTTPAPATGSTTTITWTATTAGATASGWR